MTPPTNIWACTKKKSINVLEKLVLYAAYVIDAVTALVLGATLAMHSVVVFWDTTHDIIANIVSAISTTIGGGFSLLLNIPWYGYVGIGVVAAIPVYSFLWCIARELTEDDWNSDIAENIAFLLGIVLALGPALALALMLMLALALALALMLMLMLMTCDTKLLRFAGAYLHYRKRIQSESS